MEYKLVNHFVNNSSRDRYSYLCTEWKGVFQIQNIYVCVMPETFTCPCQFPSPMASHTTASSTLVHGHHWLPLIIVIKAETNMKFMIWIVWMVKWANIRILWTSQWLYSYKHLIYAENTIHVITKISFKPVANYTICKNYAEKLFMVYAKLILSW